MNVPPDAGILTLMGDPSPPCPPDPHRAPLHGVTSEANEPIPQPRHPTPLPRPPHPGAPPPVASDVVRGQRPPPAAQHSTPPRRPPHRPDHLPLHGVSSEANGPRPLPNTRPPPRRPPHRPVHLPLHGVSSEANQPRPLPSTRPRPGVHHTGRTISRCMGCRPRPTDPARCPALDPAPASTTPTGPSPVAWGVVRGQRTPPAPEHPTPPRRPPHRPVHLPLHGVSSEANGPARCPALDPAPASTTPAGPSPVAWGVVRGQRNQPPTQERPGPVGAVQSHRLTVHGFLSARDGQRGLPRVAPRRRPGTDPTPSAPSNPTVSRFMVSCRHSVGRITCPLPASRAIPPEPGPLCWLAGRCIG